MSDSFSVVSIIIRVLDEQLCLDATLNSVRELPGSHEIIVVDGRARRFSLAISGVNHNHQQVWMNPGGSLHVAWCHGDPGEPTSPTGYLYSMDYGMTWSGSEIAISTPTEGNLPHGIVADADWVHIMAEPGAGTYARRAAPQRLEFTSIEKQADRLILKWTGQGALQEARKGTGPWNTATNAFSPHELSNEFTTGFFRLKGP